MPQLQLVFNEWDEKRNEIKILQSALKEQLDNSLEFIKITDQIKQLNSQKAVLLSAFMEENANEIEKIDVLKSDLESHKQLLSDVALKDYLSGKDIRIKDKKGFILEPVFSVKFVKTDEVEEDKNK